MTGRLTFLWHGVETTATLTESGWSHGLPEVVAMLEAIAPAAAGDPLETAAARLAGTFTPDGD